MKLGSIRASSLDPHMLNFAAGLMRIVLVVLFLTIVPVLYPSLVELRPIFFAYLPVAIVGQVFIYLRRGRWLRPLIGGFADLAVITLILHHLGSASSALVTFYAFAAVVNTLVVGKRMGLALSAIAMVMYGTTLTLESFGVVPYAPGAPDWVARTAPDPASLIPLIALTGFTTLVPAMIVGGLLARIRAEERELERANRRLTDLSIRDPLTGVFNRRYLLDELANALDARHDPDSTVAVAMLDLDGFKPVNDTHGHLLGDRLLCEIAEGIKASVRSDDLVCRFGGDEFVVLLIGADETAAEDRAREIATAVRAVGRRFDPKRGVTASVGVAVGRPGDDPADVLRRADTRAYAAKRAGGDHVVLHDLTVASGA
jgi:diguanylate cyclase (GGDEF)-like protein